MMRLLTVILALSFSVIFAKEKINPILLLQPIEKVVLLTELSPDIAKGLLEGRYPNLAVECRENMNLPIAYVFKNKIFSLNYSPNLTLKIQRSCYFRISNKRKCYFSEDLKNWDKLLPGLFDTTMNINRDGVTIEVAENDDLQLR